METGLPFRRILSAAIPVIRNEISVREILIVIGGIPSLEIYVVITGNYGIRDAGISYYPYGLLSVFPFIVIVALIIIYEVAHLAYKNDMLSQSIVGDPLGLLGKYRRILFGIILGIR